MPGLLDALSGALRDIRTRLDNLENQEVSAGTLDLGGFTLTVLSNTTLDFNGSSLIMSSSGSLDMNGYALTLASSGLLDFNGYSLIMSSSGSLDMNGYALTLASSGTLNLGGAALSLPVAVAQGGTGATSAATARSNLGTNDAGNLTTGTVATARLGSGSASAATLLFGDSTWAALAAGDIPALDASKITTGTLPIARGGTGATSAGAALTALGAAAASHAHATSDITSGTMATARLGSGSASSSTYLRGDSTWAALPASVSGSATSGQVATWNGASSITGASTLTYGSGQLAVTGGSGSLKVQGGTWTSNGNDIFLNTGTTSSSINLRPNGAGSSTGQVYVLPGGMGLDGASNPSISLAVGSNDTGLEAISSGQMDIRAGGAGIRVTSTGLGIHTVPSYELQLSADSAAKPSTNTWTVSSDGRTKRLLGPYEEGLDLLRRLRLWWYEYNGLGGTPAGERSVGLVAQEAEAVVPRWVRRHEGRLRPEDRETTELLSVNVSEATYTLINSVLDLDRRLARLEQGGEEC